MTIARTRHRGRVDAVTVTGPGGARQTTAVRAGARWFAATAIPAGESAVIAPGGLTDHFGATNGSAIPLLP